ncbi:MAG: proline dehydrogenase family protein [Candidatus Acidiferrales bacterium]
MSLVRRALLKASQNPWLCARAPRLGFVRRTAKRFLPGETMDAALAAASRLAENGLATLLTHLGENVEDRAGAEAATAHCFALLDRIRSAGLPAEISVKLTQLGLDLDSEFCFTNLSKLIEHSLREKSSGAEPARKIVWIDMEHSPYVDITLELHRRAHNAHRNTGVCVQAYLYRTEDDVASLISLGAAVRLVKGAYNEPPEIAFPKKADVDENYFRLAQMLLGAEARRAGVRAALATHDKKLIVRICAWATTQGIERDRLEFEMLYGIEPREQLRLVREGYRARVLISYGSAWFPWFTRRLAEHPANAWFLARNLFSG